MSVWLTIAEFQAQFSEPPKPETIRQWAMRGEVELWQPGGRGGKIYVRRADGNAPEGEQQLLEALDAAEATHPRKRRA